MAETSAFGLAPVFMMIAAVLAASGYLGSKVKSSSEPTPPPRLSA